MSLLQKINFWFGSIREKDEASQNFELEALEQRVLLSGDAILDILPDEVIENEVPIVEEVFVADQEESQAEEETFDSVFFVEEIDSSQDQQIDEQENEEQETIFSVEPIADEDTQTENKRETLEDNTKNTKTKSTDQARAPPLQSSDSNQETNKTEISEPRRGKTKVQEVRDRTYMLSWIRSGPQLYLQYVYDRQDDPRRDFYNESGNAYFNYELHDPATKNADLRDLTFSFGDIFFNLSDAEKDSYINSNFGNMYYAGYSVGNRSGINSSGDEAFYRDYYEYTDSNGDGTYELTRNTWSYEPDFSYDYRKLNGATGNGMLQPVTKDSGVTVTFDLLMQVQNFPDFFYNNEYIGINTLTLYFLNRVDATINDYDPVADATMPSWDSDKVFVTAMHMSIDNIENLAFSSSNVSLAANSPAQNISQFMTVVDGGEFDHDAGLDYYGHYFNNFDNDYTVTNDNNSLFSVQPTFEIVNYWDDVNGRNAWDANLTFTPASGASGTATVTVSRSNTQWKIWLGDDDINDEAVSLQNAGFESSLSSILDLSSTYSHTVTGNYSGSDYYFHEHTDDGAQSFTITIEPVNAPPSFTVGSTQTVVEDSGAQSVNNFITNISCGAGETGQTVTFTATATDTSLFSVQPSIASNGTLTYTPAANASGSTTVSVIAQDDGGTNNGGDDTSDAQLFTIQITPVNDEPSFSVASNPSVNEDSGSKQIVNFITGLSVGPPDESSQFVTYTVSNDNNSLFSSQPTINSSGTLEFTPADDAFGSATVSVYATDNGGTANGGDNQSATVSFTITVNNINDPPDFTLGSYPEVAENSGAQSFANWIASSNPGTGESDSITYSIVSNTNSALFSVAPSIASNGTLSFTIADSKNGSAIIGVQATDDGGTANGGVNTSATKTFAIYVTSVNDAPSFSLSAVPTVLEDSGTNTHSGFVTNISPGPADESSQTVSFLVTNDDNSFFSVQPTINSAGDLSYTLADNAYGSVTIRIRAQDNGGTSGGGVDTSAEQSFTLTVTNVNDAPSFTLDAGPTVLEDAGAQTHSGFVISTDSGNGDPAQNFTYALTTSNDAFFSVLPAISSAGVLTYTTATHVNGSVTVTVTATDDGGTANGGSNTSASKDFVITVTPVNDAPSFVLGANITVDEDSGAYSQTNFATPTQGPTADELTQGVSYSLSVVNEALFSVLPTIDGSGTLTFTPADNAFGSTSITVSMSDDGGTANGGIDQAVSTADFNVTLNPVQDAPILSATNDTITYTPGSGQTVLNPTLSIQELDGDDIASLTIDLNTAYQIYEDVLRFIDTANISANFDYTTGQLTLSGTDSVTRYASALLSVVYHNMVGVPFTVARTVDLIVTDSAGQSSSPLTININFNPVEGNVFNWISTTGGDWGDYNNWDRGNIPVEDSLVVIPDLAGDQTITYSLAEALPLLTLQSKEELVISNGSIQVANSAFLFDTTISSTAYLEISQGASLQQVKTMTLTDSSQLKIPGSASVVDIGSIQSTMTSSVELSGTIESQGSLSFAGSSSLNQTAGLIDLTAGSLGWTDSATLNQTGGEIRLSGGSITSSNALTFGATLSGSGSINSDLQVSGSLSPGVASADATGSLTINGNLTLLSGGSLRLDLGDASDSDKLTVNGDVDFTLGKLTIRFANTFSGSIGDSYSYTLVNWTGTSAGNFAEESLAGDAATLTMNANSMDYGLTVPENTTQDDIRAGLTTFNGQANDFSSFFDLANITAATPSLPVIPENLESIFDTASVLSTLAMPDPGAITPVAMSEVVESLITAGFTVHEVQDGYTSLSGSFIQDTTGEYAIKFSWSETLASARGIQGGYGGDTWNMETSGILKDLASDASLTGILTLAADLGVELIFGIDSNGFFLFNSSSIFLTVTASGALTGTATVSGTSRNLTANVSSTQKVALRPVVAQERYRMNELTASVLAPVLNATSQGTAQVSISLSLGDTSLTAVTDYTLTEDTADNSTSIVEAYSLTGSMTIPELYQLGTTTLASATLTGTRTPGTGWTLSGLLSGNFELADLTGSDFSFTVSMDDTSFTGSGTMALSFAYLTDGTNPVAINFDASLSESQLTLTGSSTIANLSVLRADDTVMMTASQVSFSSNMVSTFSSDTFTGSLTLSAENAVIAPNESALTLTDGDDGDSFALTGTLNVGSQVFSLVMDQVTTSVSGWVSIVGNNIAMNWSRNNTAGNQELMRNSTTTVTLTDFGVQGALTDLVLYQDGSIGATGLTVSDLSGINSYVLASLFNFNVSGISVEFLNWDSNSNGTLDAGEQANISNFNMVATGGFDFSALSNFPFTPSVQIGSNEYSTSGSNSLSLDLRLVNGTLTPWNLDTLRLGFTGLGVEGVISFEGNIQLGGYTNGVWADNFGGSFSLASEAGTKNVTGTTSSAITGSFNNATGAISANGQLSLGFVLQDFVTIDGVVIDFAMSSAYVSGATPSINLSSYSLQSSSISSIAIAVGGYLELSAASVSLNFDPNPGEYMATFGTLTAAIPDVGLSGTASNFALSGDGEIAALEGFSVSINTDTDVDSTLAWPEWMPIQVDAISLTWDDFNNDPTDFLLVFNATVNTTSVGGAPIELQGFVDQAVIDVGKLVNGEFPIVSISGVGISAGGEIGGTEISGSLFLAIARFDASGNLIDSADVTTAVADRVLYGGIEATATIAGYGGFSIMLGLSEYGPLSGYIKVDNPVVVDPVATGTIITSMAAGITFASTLPDIDDPMMLASDPENGNADNPELKSAGDLELSEWQGLLLNAVKNARDSMTAGADPLSALTSKMKIEGSVTLSTYYGGSSVYEMQGTFLFDTEGRFLAGGSFQMADGSVDIFARLYMNLSQIKSGQGQILLYGVAPAELETVVFYGGISLSVNGGVSESYSPGDQLSSEQMNALTTPDSFTLSFSGGVIINAFDVINLEVFGSVVLDFNMNESIAQIQLDGKMSISLIGDLIGVQGKMTVDFGAEGFPDLYGAIALKPGEFSSLEAMGLTVDAVAVLRFNNTDNDQTISLQPYGQSEAKTYEVKNNSVGILLEGYLAFDLSGASWFRFHGLAEITFGTSVLNVVVDATLELGDFANFDAVGFIQVTSAGFAAKMDVSRDASGEMEQYGVSMLGSFLLEINTTKTDVTYEIPSELPAVGESRTVTLTRGPPQADGSTADAEEYLYIHGTQQIILAEYYQFEGDIHLLATPSALEFIISAKYHASVGGVTLFDFDGTGGFRLDSNGLAGLIDLQFASDFEVAESFGLSVDASFALQINTTGSEVTLLSGDTLAAGNYVRMKATGDFMFGPMRLSGDFFLEASSDSFSVTADASLQVVVGSTTLISFQTNAGFEISSQGAVGVLELSLNTDFANGYGLELNVSFKLHVNTTGSDQELSGVQLAADEIAVVKMSGTLEVMGFATFLGNFEIFIKDDAWVFQMDAAFDLKAGDLQLMSFQASGGIALLEDGVAGSLSLEAKSVFNTETGLRLSGAFAIHINTSSSAVTLSDKELEADSFEFELVGQVDIMMIFSIQGEMRMKVLSDSVETQLAGTMSIFGVGLSFSAGVGIYSDGIALQAALSLGGMSFAADEFVLGGDFSFEVNTTGTEKLGITANTLLIKIDNATLSIHNYELIGTSLWIGYKEGAFAIIIPENDPLTVSVFGGAEARFSGEIRSDGYYNLKAYVGISLGSENMVYISGSLSLTVLQSRIDVSLDGDMKVLGVGASVKGGGTIRDDGSFSLRASFMLLEMFEVSGSFIFHEYDDGIYVEADLDTELYGISGQISGYFDDRPTSEGWELTGTLGVDFGEEYLIRVKGSLTLSFNSKGDQSIGASMNFWVLDNDLGTASYTLNFKHENEMSFDVNVDFSISGILDIRGKFSVVIDTMGLYATVDATGSIGSIISGKLTGEFIYGIRKRDWNLQGEAKLTAGDKSVALIEGNVVFKLSSFSKRMDMDAKAYLFDKEVYSMMAEGRLNADGVAFTVNTQINVMDVLNIKGDFFFTLDKAGLYVKVDATANLWGFRGKITGLIDTRGGFKWELTGELKFRIGGDSLGAEGSIVVELGNDKARFAVGFRAWAGFYLHYPEPSWIDIEMKKVWIGGELSINAELDLGNGIITFGIAGFDIHIKFKDGFSIYTSRLAGSTVFLDANHNGILDAGEVSTIADENGNFNFRDDMGDVGEVVVIDTLGILAKYDLNGNGVLDSNEGTMYSVGGAVADAPWLFYRDDNGNGALDAGEASEAIARDQVMYNRMLELVYADKHGSAPTGTWGWLDANGDGRIHRNELTNLKIVDPSRATTIRQLSENNPRGMLGLTGATSVFFDVNGNGVLDSGEASVSVNDKGYYDFSDQIVPNRLGLLAPFDTNGNGRIDYEEGVIVVQGGTDLDNGLQTEMNLRAVATDYGSGFGGSVNPYTTMVVSLVEQGMTIEEAEKKVDEVFNPETPFSFAQYNPYEYKERDNTQTMSGAAKINTLLLQGGYTAGNGDTDSQKAVAEQIAVVIKSQGTIDFTDSATILKVLEGATKATGKDVKKNALGAASVLTTDTLKLIDAVSEGAGTDLDKRLSTIKAANQTTLKTSLTGLTNGSITVSSFLSDNKASKLVESVFANYGDATFQSQLLDIAVAVASKNTGDSWTLYRVAYVEVIRNCQSESNIFARTTSSFVRVNQLEFAEEMEIYEGESQLIERVMKQVRQIVLTPNNYSTVSRTAGLSFAFSVNTNSFFQSDLLDSEKELLNTANTESLVQIQLL